MKWVLVSVAIIGVVVLATMYKGKTTTTTGTQETSEGVGGLLGGIANLFGGK